MKKNLVPVSNSVFECAQHSSAPKTLLREKSDPAIDPANYCCIQDYFLSVVWICFLRTSRNLVDQTIKLTMSAKRSLIAGIISRLLR